VAAHNVLSADRVLPSGLDLEFFEVWPQRHSCDIFTFAGCLFASHAGAGRGLPSATMACRLRRPATHSLTTTEVIFSPWPGAPLFSRIETGARVASAFYRRRVILTVISSPSVYLGSVLNIWHRGKIMMRLVLRIVRLPDIVGCFGTNP
jgi:hypothetical protein